MIRTMLVKLRSFQICTRAHTDRSRYSESIARSTGRLAEYPDVLAKTVIVTGCNRGFVNHLQNFNCFMEKLGFKFLVVSMDRHTHEYLTTHTNMKSFYYRVNFTNHLASKYWGVTNRFMNRRR